MAKKPKPNKEFVDKDGGDYGMHAAILGKDDQFIVKIPVKKPA